MTMLLLLFHCVLMFLLSHIDPPIGLTDQRKIARDFVDSIVTQIDLFFCAGYDVVDLFGGGELCFDIVLLQCFFSILSVVP